MPRGSFPDPKACLSLQFQQSVKKRTITLQGKPQVFSGHVVTAVPLLFQTRSLVGRTLHESLHRRSYHLVCFFDRSAWFVHETSLYLVPLRSEIPHLRFKKTRTQALTLQLLCPGFRLFDFHSLGPSACFCTML